MAAQHVIELNGKRYDTVTGKIITDARPTTKTKTPAKTPVKAATKQPSRARNIDGFTRPKAGSRAATKPQRSASHPNHTKRHIDKSHTLMRAPAKAQTIRSVSADVSPSTGFLAPSTPRITVDPQRLKRAQSIPQNKFIGRFVANSTPAATTIEPATVPVLPVAQTVPVAPLTPPSPLEQAVSRAKSHEQPRATKPRAHHRVARKLHVKPRTVSAVSVLLIAGTLLGFVTYRHLPDVHMKLASSRAGITGTVPSSTPSGYKLGNDIGYKPGEITLSFYSNSDQRTFTVIETESYWTSDLLRENYVETLGVDYQTVQENGKTIYLYGNNATWVDGGIWYRIEGKDAALSSSQITNLAKSL